MGSGVPFRQRARHPADRQRTRPGRPARQGQSKPRQTAGRAGSCPSVSADSGSEREEEAPGISYAGGMQLSGPVRRGTLGGHDAGGQTAGSVSKSPLLGAPAGQEGAGHGPAGAWRAQSGAGGACPGGFAEEVMLRLSIRGRGLLEDKPMFPGTAPRTFCRDQVSPAQNTVHAAPRVGGMQTDVLALCPDLRTGSRRAGAWGARARGWRPPRGLQPSTCSSTVAMTLVAGGTEASSRPGGRIDGGRPARPGGGRRVGNPRGRLALGTAPRKRSPAADAAARGDTAWMRTLSRQGRGREQGRGGRARPTPAPCPPHAGAGTLTPGGPDVTAPGEGL